MQITALGHSCVLLSLIDPATGEPTRILVDPWLSDHATGDAMGRFPRLRLDLAALAPVHAVFLSHAHCDHLDPYSLVRLWRELPEPPVLLLPVSLSHLVPLFEEFLPQPELLILQPHTPTPFRGVELLGFYDVGHAPNNEEDVLILVVSCGTERVLVEADARLSLELPHLRTFVGMLMQAPGLDSAVWLTTENELTGTLLGRLCQGPADRGALAELAHEELDDDVAWLYAPAEPEPGMEGLPQADPWQTPHLLRLVHGQGLAAIPEADPRWQRVLFPVTVAHRVDREREVAAEAGCRHSVDQLTVGAVHTVEQGQLTEICPLPGLTLLDAEADRGFEVDLDFFPQLPVGPVWPGEREVEGVRARVQALLDEHFLPWLHGARSPPVLHLLADHGGEYRVRVFLGSTLEGPALDYVLAFDATGFLAEPADPGLAPQEAYWASDLVDFLDGRCDEFSPTCRQPLGAADSRLWDCLATPLLNGALVRARVRLHFERAVAGEDAGSWVRAMVGPA